MPRNMISACPVAFGETDVKERIKNVVNYKKPAFWITIASIMVCVAVGVCFATNKGSKTVDEQQVAVASVEAIPKGTKLVGVIETSEGVLRVRQAPDDDAECIGFLAPDDEVEIIEDADGWYKIGLEDGEGYIKSDYVNIGSEKDANNSESN